MTLRPPATLVLLLPLAACANQSWEHPSVPPERWPADIAECRALARAEVRREEQRFAMRDWLYPDIGRDRLEAERRRRDERDFRMRQLGREPRLMDRCLIERGYRRSRNDEKGIDPSILVVHRSGIIPWSIFVQVRHHGVNSDDRA